MRSTLSNLEIGALLLLFLAAGAYLADSFDHHGGLAQASVPERQLGYEFTSPLLDCGLAEQDKTLTYLSMKRSLNAIIELKKTRGDIDSASVYVRNLNNGPWLGIDENDDFSPASLLKVAQLIAVLKKAERDPSLLERRLVYAQSDDLNSIESIRAGDGLRPGASYAVRDLLEHMIIRSDNNASRLLLDVVTIDDISEFYAEIGIPETALGSGEAISVKTYASFYRILYNSSYLSREMSEYALKLLSRTAYNDGIVAPLPPGMKAAHKFGERTLMDPGGASARQLHDCGIVYSPAYPYLVCIMTRGRDFAPLSQAIRDISGEIYEHIVEE